MSHTAFEIKYSYLGIQIKPDTHTCSCLSRLAYLCLNAHIFRWTLPTFILSYVCVYMYIIIHFH